MEVMLKQILSQLPKKELLNSKNKVCKLLLLILLVVINSKKNFLIKWNKYKKQLILIILFLLWIVLLVNNVIHKLKLLKKLLMLVVLWLQKWMVILKVEELYQQLQLLKVQLFLWEMVNISKIYNLLMLLRLLKDF